MGELKIKNHIINGDLTKIKNVSPSDYFLQLSGGTITGDLSINGNLTVNEISETKKICSLYNYGLNYTVNFPAKNVWVAPNVTYNQKFLFNFSVSGNSITYTHQTTDYFLIILSGNIERNTENVDVSMGISINDSIPSMGYVFKKLTHKVSFTITSIYQLNQNDVIKMALMSATNNSSVIINDVDINIIKI
jgi:hypothetical protein